MYTQRHDGEAGGQRWRFFSPQGPQSERKCCAGGYWIDRTSASTQPWGLELERPATAALGGGVVHPVRRRRRRRPAGLGLALHGAPFAVVTSNASALKGLVGHRHHYRLLGDDLEGDA